MFNSRIVLQVLSLNQRRKFILWKNCFYHTTNWLPFLNKLNYFRISIAEKKSFQSRLEFSVLMPISIFYIHYFVINICSKWKKRSGSAAEAVKYEQTTRQQTPFFGGKKIRCTCGDSEIHCLPISSVYRLIYSAHIILVSNHSNFERFGAILNKCNQKP